MPAQAGVAPGPSDPIPSQPDEVEAIAETIWRAEYRRATGRERSIPWSEVSSTDRERYRYVADAILAMQAEMSQHYQKMMKAAEEYFTLVRQPAPNRTLLATAESRLNELSIPFSDDPAFQALLKLERETKACRGGNSKPMQAERAKIYNECADYLQTLYPDNASTNAFCAAIRVRGIEINNE